MPHFGIVTAWMALRVIALSTLRIAASIAWRTRYPGAFQRRRERE